MKPKHLIPPIAALAIAGLLLGGQRRSIANLKSESAELRRHIAAAHEAPQAPDNPRSRANKPSADKLPIDWEKLAGEIKGIKEQNGTGDMRKMMSLQRRLLAMESWELVAALDQIAALDVDEETRSMLDGLILDPLVKKDPETALNRFKAKISDGSGWQSWQLSSALGNWAEKDLPAATAWFDKELAAGTFESKTLDGNSAVRDQFESKLVAKMLESDLSGANVWLSGKTADARKDLLGGVGFQNLSEKDQAAHADLIRSQLDDEGRLDLIGKRASNLAYGGDFAAVDAYLSRIDAKPDERQRSVENSAQTYLRSLAGKGKLTEVEIDTMREWAGKGAPDSVDRITGDEIGNFSRLSNGPGFPAAAALALKYHGSTGNDEILVGFLLRANPAENRAEALGIAGKISDPAKRQEMINRFK